MEALLAKVTNPRLLALLALCQKEIPGFTIVFKDRSRWMKFLNFFAQIFNPKFMTKYTTTAKATVYFPTEEFFLSDPERAFDILAHELVHMVDKRKNGFIRHDLAYAFPAVLAVLAVFVFGAFWNLWFLLSLVFLLALLPMPSPWRKDIEMRGYTMSMAVFYWRWATYGEDQFQFIADQFTGPAYYFMWPFKKSVMRELKRRFIAVQSGKILEDPIFRAVYDIVKPS